MKKLLLVLLILYTYNLNIALAESDDENHKIQEISNTKELIYDEYKSSQESSKTKSGSLDKINNLINSGFKCNKDSQIVKIRGFVCIGKVSSYADNIRIYIPENLEADSVKYNIFFHGLRRNDTFLEDNSGQAYGDYGARLKESKNKRAVLIIPESSSGVSSYEQFSRDPNKFLNLINEVKSKSEIEFSEFTISGHSGAYRVINYLLGTKHIRDQVNHVGLFDSIYGPLPNIENWIKENSQNKLRLAWLSGIGESTSKWTNDFLSKMSKYSGQITNLKIKGEPQTATHMNIMQTGGLADFINGE